MSSCPKSLFVESRSPRCDAFKPTRCRTWRVDFRALPEGIRPPLFCASRCQCACFALHRFKNASRILDCTDLSYALTSASELFAPSVLASNKRALIVLATSTCSLPCFECARCFSCDSFQPIRCRTGQWLQSWTSIQNAEIWAQAGVLADLILIVLFIRIHFYSLTQKFGPGFLMRGVLNARL